TVTANGTLTATGIGAIAIANSGTATTKVGGDIELGGGTGISPLGALSLGTFDLTVGAGAVSDTGAAKLNILGGNISGADIGGMAVVLDGSQTAQINVGDGTSPTSSISANVIGLLGFNSGHDGNVLINVGEN